MTAPFPRTSCARWQFCADFAVISAQECHFAPGPDDAAARRRRAGPAALGASLGAGYPNGWRLPPLGGCVTHT